MRSWALLAAVGLAMVSVGVGHGAPHGASPEALPGAPSAPDAITVYSECTATAGNIPPGPPGHPIGFCGCCAPDYPNGQWSCWKVANEPHWIVLQVYANEGEKVLGRADCGITEVICDTFTYCQFHGPHTINDNAGGCNLYFGLRAVCKDQSAPPQPAPPQSLGNGVVLHTFAFRAS